MTNFLNGPHGISNFLNENSEKIETRQTADRTELKRSSKTPFPQPLLTRNTYGLDVPQPPLRNIFRRIRRSRRNARSNMISNAKDASSRSRAVVPHKEKCRCRLCLSKKAIAESKKSMNNSRSQKRKAESEISAFDTKKKKKVSNSTISDDDSEKNLVPTTQTMASPLKHLLPRKSIDCDAPIQHTPVIKIKYKSPAGRGRIMNIPSKPHTGEEYKSSSSTSNKCVKGRSTNKKLIYAEKKDANKKALPNKKVLSNDSKHLQMLKRIANVEIQHVNDGSGKETDKKLSQNEYLVFVKHDNKKPSKSVASAQASKIKESHPGKRLKKRGIAKKSIFDRSIPSAVKEGIRSNLISTNSIEKRHLRIILQPLSSSKTDLDALDASKNNKNCINSSGKSMHNLRISPNIDFKKVNNVKKSPSPKSHTMYVTTCKDITGVIYAQGDVVWSKLSGYPWWPSRIIKLIVTKTDGEILQQEAMVGWFCSATTSIIPLSSIQPFEKSFDVRFEKRRKGLYQKAVNEAKSALKKISPEVRKLISQFET